MGATSQADSYFEKLSSLSLAKLKAEKLSDEDKAVLLKIENQKKSPRKLTVAYLTK